MCPDVGIPCLDSFMVFFFFLFSVCAKVGDKVMNFVRQVVAGLDFTLALLESGMVMAFGYNAGGRLGTGNTRHQQVPTPILEGVKLVAAGYDHAFAVLENGKCLGWGSNLHGCIRVGGDPEIHTPTIVDGLENTIEIKAGSSTTLAISEDGHYSFWGKNFQRQVVCLQDLGLAAGLNWKPSDAARGEVATEAIPDPNSYDFKELLASLREGASSEEKTLKQFIRYNYRIFGLIIRMLLVIFGDFQGLK